MPRSRNYNLGLDTAPAPRPAISPLFASATGSAVPPGELTLDQLLDNPFQPAARGDPDAVAELAEVIARQGFHGRLLGRAHPDRPGYYQLAYGHQRRDAARLAGLISVPVDIQDLTDREMVEQIVTENIHRQDLTDYHEAQTYGLMETTLGMSHEEIATAVGKKRVYVSKRLTLLTAPTDVQDLVREVPGSFSAALNIKQIADPAVRAELISDYRAGHLTTQDLAEARRTAPADLSPAPRHPAVVVGPPSADEATEAAARGGLLKLNTAAEALLRWGQLAAERDVALREYTKLCAIRDQVETLIAHHQPGKG